MENYYLHYFVSLIIISIVSLNMISGSLLSGFHEKDKEICLNKSRGRRGKTVED